MIPPPSPVTTEAARLWLLAHQLRDPSRVALEHLPHPGFEADPVAGGVAFVLTGRYGTTLVHVLADGGYGYRQDPGDEAGRRAAIDDLWTHQRVRTGSLRPSEPHPCDRAARTALERGVTWVADLPVADRPGVGPAELPDAERRRLALRAGRDVAWPGVRPRPPVGVAEDLDLLVLHVAQVAGVLGRVSGLPTGFVPDRTDRGDAYPFVRLDEDGTLGLGARERGKTLLDRRTRDPDELLLWVFDDVASQMGLAYEAGHRRGSEDFRRGWVPVWTALLELLDPAWPSLSRASTLPPFDDGVGRDLPML